MWPPGGQNHFFLCAVYRAEFSTHLLQIHAKYLLDRDQDSNLILSRISDICGHQGVNFVLYCVHSIKQSFQLIFKFSPNIHWAIVWTPIHCFHQLVTFVATRVPTLIFIMCTLQSRVFNQSSSDSQQIFIWPCSLS